MSTVLRPIPIPAQVFSVRNSRGSVIDFIARPTADEALRHAIAIYGEHVWLTRNESDSSVITRRRERQAVR